MAIRAPEWYGPGSFSQILRRGATASFHAACGERTLEADVIIHRLEGEGATVLGVFLIQPWPVPQPLPVGDPVRFGPKDLQESGE